MVKNGSHCVGLYGRPDDDKVLASAREVQKELIRIVGRWVGAAPGRGSLSEGGGGEEEKSVFV